MDKLKYIKLENDDGSYSDSIPLAVDSNYVNVNGETLTTALNKKTSQSDFLAEVDLRITEDNALHAQISSLASGSPAGVYNTVTALTNADPNHNKIYVVSANGHWYYYNNGWQDGGVYQAVINNDISNDIETVTYDIYEVENDYSQTISIVENSAIVVMDGNYATNAKRARTGRQGFTRIRVAILDSDTYLMRPFFYTAQTGSWIESYVRSSQDWGNKFYLGYYPYVAFSFKRIDEADWTSADTIALRSSLHFYQLTDPSLSIEGASADAKIVGDKIAELIDQVGIIDDVDYITNTMSFSSGSISTDTGELLDNWDNRVRTIRGLDRFIHGLHVVLDNTNYTFSLRFFSSDVNYVDNYVGWANWCNEYIVTEAQYFGLVFRRIDNAVMTETDVANIRASLHIYKKTDVTFTLHDVPADSAAVGRLQDKLDVLNINNDRFSTQFLDILKGKAIVWATGAEGSNNARAKTEKMDITTLGQKILLKNANYLMGIGYYMDNETASSGYTNVCSYWKNEFVIDQNYPYCALSFKKVDETNVTNADIKLIREALYTYSATDETLTVEGVAADAKIVGDALRNGNFNKEIRILGIGNSYTRDCLRWVCKILKESSLYTNVIVGHGYWGGSTLAQQYASLDPEDENHTIFQYWKYNNTINATKTNNKTLDAILEDEDWDIVIFQQQSDESGQYNSFVSDDFDINDFIDYIKEKINNENLLIGINATWSHASAYTSTRFTEYYAGNNETQYLAIQDVFPKVAKHMSQCDFVINTGLAIKLGRENIYLNAIGNEMLRSDNNHLAVGIPDFMCSFLYACVITGTDLSKITWYPTTADSAEVNTETTAYLANLAKQCAIKAMINIPRDSSFLNATMSMWPSFGVCGASWDSGYVYPTNSGSSAIENEYMSWGANLARRNGNTFYNFSKASMTTRSYISNTNCLPKLLSSPVCDLYIITLGGNDSSNLGIDYLGEESDMTNDYLQNPDTFYGNYARIIESIQNYAPNAKIILTYWYDPSKHGVVRAAFNDAVTNIANHYNIPKISWIDDAWYRSAFFQQHLVHTHPTAYQLSGVALAFERLFSKCVAEHVNYFDNFIVNL